VHFGESEKFEGMKNLFEGREVHKPGKVEIKHGKFHINPAKSEDRAKVAKMFISG
jgi:hypothetical protein